MTITHSDDGEDEQPEVEVVARYDGDLRVLEGYLPGRGPNQGPLALAREIYADMGTGRAWEDEDPEVQQTLVHLAEVRVRPLGRDDVARVVQLQLWITFRQLMQAVDRGRFTEKQVVDDLAGRNLIDEWRAFRLLPEEPGDV